MQMFIKVLTDHIMKLTYLNSCIFGLFALSQVNFVQSQLRIFFPRSQSYSRLNGKPPSQSGPSTDIQKETGSWERNIDQYGIGGRLDSDSSIGYGSGTQFNVGFGYQNQPNIGRNRAQFDGNGYDSTGQAGPNIDSQFSNQGHLIRNDDGPSSYYEGFETVPNKRGNRFGARNDDSVGTDQTHKGRKISDNPSRSSDTDSNNWNYMIPHQMKTTEGGNSFQQPCNVTLSQNGIPKNCTMPGRRILTNVKSNCPVGSEADTSGVCRENYSK